MACVLSGCSSPPPSISNRTTSDRVQGEDGLTLDQLAECIDSGGESFGSICALTDKTDGPYDVTVELTVRRPGITVRGDAADPTLTTLRRADPGLSTIVRVFAPDVTFESLVFDGNRAINATDPGAEELVLDEGASLATVSRCVFLDSPTISMNLGTAGTLVTSSTFTGGRVTGIWGGGDPCPSNFEIRGNRFERFGTGAVGLEGCTHHGSVIGNRFVANHREFVFDAPGGELTVSPEAHDITISDNSFDGGAVQSDNGLWISMGIEAWGSRLAITDNDIRNHLGAGISCLDCRQVVISQTRSDVAIAGNGAGNASNPPGDGITVYNSTAETQFVDDVSVIGVAAEGNANYGINFVAAGLPMTNIRAVSNTGCNTQPGIGADGPLVQFVELSGNSACTD
jgi:hypothetical protein